jgi:uncharacterized protein YjbI with pentapeptide repeats
VTSEEEGIQSLPLPPTTSDPEAWKAYWKTQDQPWRTEPEISPQRQEELQQRRSIVPDIDKGIYPFGGMKLHRADVEWLLATHENGRGPVDWNDENQRGREGIDLRGADLRSLNLSRLPLARMYGGGRWWSYGTAEQHEAVLAQFEGASFVYSHLEGAVLEHAHLENADLSSAHLESTNLRRAHLDQAWLAHAHLEHANLHQAHLEGASLDSAFLGEADLRNAFFDHTTKLQEVVLDNKGGQVACLVDVHWGEVNLAVVKWSGVKMLGDECQARQKTQNGKVKERRIQLEEYERAVRANRQLAVALQMQGLNEDAARFAYRAQKLQRVVSRRQRKFGQYFFSIFLDLLAGYGYRPGRSVFWYLVIIFGFALAYYAFGHLSLFPPDAFVYSLTSFHGRGFFPGLDRETSLHDPLVMLAALEAVVGLLIEISFIATFTQRFFGK